MIAEPLAHWCSSPNSDSQIASSYIARQPVEPQSRWSRVRACSQPEKMVAYKGQQRLCTGETMRRREFIALAGASVALPFAATAQEPGRTYHLGCLWSVPRDTPIANAFFNELRRRGFIEGQNLTVEYRAYGEHVDRISQYAAELVQARVDVIATAGEEAVRAVQQVTKTIPIVAIVGDMYGSGLVKSQARPDGNTTGVSILAFEAEGKRQDILIEAVPGLRLMAVLTDVNYTKYAKLDELQKVARAHNIEFLTYRIARGEEIAAAIENAQVSGATALNTVSSPLFHAHISSWSAQQQHTCPRSMNFLKRLRKAALPPTDRALVSC
jgi:putative ABC transport system substrate-binding protein